MAIIFSLFCGLFVSALLGEHRAVTGCKGNAVNKIAKVLTEVDWEQLAGELNIELGTRNTISADCKLGSGAIAVCCRRGLVQYYCDSTALELEQVVENIAQALERMEKRTQAKTLRKEFGVTAESSTPSQPSPQTSTASSTNGGSSATDPGQSQVPEPSPFYHTLVQNWIDLSTREIILAGAVTAVAGLLAIRVCFNCKKKPEKGKSSPSPPSSPSSPDPPSSVDKKHSGKRSPKVDPLNEPIFDERVDGIKLVVIKYTKDGKQKELRIKEKIAPQWKSLAPLLGLGDQIDNLDIEAFHRPVDATSAMLTKWMTTDTEFSWGKLVWKMRDAGLNVPAEDLAYALRHISE